MKGTIDMSNAQEQGTIQLPPQGIYNVEIVEKRDGTSKSGDVMVAIKLVITDGEFRGSWVWDNLVISDDIESPGYKILGRTKHFLHCINQPYEGKTVEWDSDNWLGRICKIRIDHEPPNEYHKRIKGIVTEYILDEEIEQEPMPF